MNNNLIDDNTTPIILNKDGKEYILMNIRLEDDGSIYFDFPYLKSNKRRIVEYRIQKLKQKNFKPLKPYTKENEDIHISFHPRDMIIHVRSNKYGPLSNDYPIKNTLKKEEGIATNFLHILMPNDISFYKEYNNRHTNCIHFNSDNITDKTIYLEFVVFSKETSFRKEFYSSDFIVGYDFLSTTNWTYGVAMSQNNIETDNSYYVGIYTKKKYLSYKIK